MHGVFGLRITLGRPFPESLPVVSPTSSPSPLRNSPGFPPGSPRPHRGRTMHATQISTCARNSRRAVPPTPCRSRPPAPCRRRVGHVERCSTWTWGCGRGSTSHPRGNSVRQDTPCHATWQAPRSPTHLPRRRTGHAPHCRQNSPRRTGHGNWLAPPMRRGRSQEATTAKTVDAADERMRTRSRHRNVPRDAWYFAPPWYFGSTSRPVPHHVANPTIPNTSATGSLGQDPLGRPDHHLTRARAHFHSHCETCSVSESASCGLVLHSLHP